MKPLFKKSASIFLMLTAMCLFGSGCHTLKTAVDPLSGWQIAYKEDSSHAIDNDLNDFIKQHSPEGYRPVHVIGYYKNSTGQHALNLELFEYHKNSSWHYVLIYDKNDKGIKVIKYDFRKYQS